MSNSYDIAIVGGGLVGASLACALGREGFSVAMIEAVEPRAATQPSYDDRTLVLGQASSRILQSLGIWDGLEEQGITPVKEIHVSELGKPGKVSLVASEHNLDQFAHVVEARIFGAAVLAAVEQTQGITSLCPVKVTAVEQSEDMVALSLDQVGKETQIQARLVVAADGAQSFIRESLGIEKETYDYGQTALICNVTPEQPHQGRAYERFTETGPFAILPHVGGRCGLVWSVATDQAEHWLNCSEDEFLKAAQERFGFRLGYFKKMGRRSIYPLKLVRAKEDIRDRVVIMGNAAHAIHPVGAQGFNLGLRDVAVLTEVLSEAKETNPQLDPGDQDLLARYSAWRKEDHHETINYSDGIARLYANPSLLTALGRSVGMAAYALLPSMQKRLVLESMGYRGRVPKMARGEFSSGSRRS